MEKQTCGQDCFHEPLGESESEAAPLSSDRNFCFVFACIFAAIGLNDLRFGRLAFFWLVLSGLFFGIALFKPALAAPLNRLWGRFGTLWAKLMNPLFLALIYFGVIVPVGLFFRLRGKVFLSLKFDPSAKSYWIDSQKIKSANMINQF